MGDVFPDTRLFDELEFLRFSDDQFASELDCPENEDGEQTSLFPSSVSDPCMYSVPASPTMHTLSELKEAVASCTVAIYRSPEPEQKMLKDVGPPEKTLNALVMDDDLQADASKRACSEDAVVMSPVSLSAFCKRSPAEMGPEMLQSSEISQTSSPEMRTVAASTEVPRRRRLKVLRKPHIPDCKPQQKNKSVASADKRASKRRCSSDVVDSVSDSIYFKTTKKMKRYQEAPCKNPEMERCRLNAINAKINRDRKKEELKNLNERCEALASENRQLDNTNQDLAGRLQAAEEEIAFLRSALLNRSAPALPALDEILKSVFEKNSAPAGG